MPSGSKMRAWPIGATLSWFLAHRLLAILIIGTVSVSIVGLVENTLAAWLKSPISFADILLLSFVFNFGLVLGFLANRTLRKRAFNWIWVPGLGWMILGIRDVLRTYGPRWYPGCSATQTVVNAFFIGGHKCGSGEDALYGLFFTMPALVLAGYSIGAWIAFRSRRDKDVIPVHLA